MDFPDKQFQSNYIKSHPLPQMQSIPSQPPKLQSQLKINQPQYHLKLQQSQIVPQTSSTSTSTSTSTCSLGTMPDSTPLTTMNNNEIYQTLSSLEGSTITTMSTNSTFHEYQKIIQCSPVKEVREQMTRQTKYLCAVILTLVLVILGLVFFDRGSSSSYSSSKSHGYNSAQHMTGRHANQGDQQQASKLLVSSTDNHYVFPGDHDDQNHDDDDDLHHHSNANGQNQDENNDFNQVTNSPKNRANERFFGRPGFTKLRDSEAICMTPGCVRAAAQILNNMDNKTKPCEDFYQFACGRWIQTQIIPDEKTSLSVFSQNTADLNVKLRALIERKATENDPPIVGQMRNMYASCMNLSDIESRGDKPLLDVLNDFGGWPVLMTNYQQQSRKFSWLDTIIKFRQRGFSHDMIIDLSVVPDVRNNRRYIIELDQTSLGLPDRSYYFKGLNDTTVSAYFDLMVESAVMLGASRQEAKKQMFEVLEFEVSLAKISVPREQRRNVSRLYNKMLAKDLSSLAPNIDWQKYLSSLLQDEQLDLNVDEVIVKVPSFIKSIDQLLINTEPKIIANYMMWRIVRHSMSGLTKRWRELAHSYSTVTTGRQIEEPRWEQCLGSLEGTLSTALSAFYVKNHFNSKSKSNALEMVEYIRSEFLKILDEIDWMDEETRDEAKLKAKGISPYIGYPDELLQDDLIEELYSGLSLSKSNFYQNVRNLRIWSTNYAFKQLRKQNKRGDWRKHARAAVVNAYYNSLENSIEFPAGILQGAFFDSDRPNYMNFGAIGYVIGHEITHGFDDRGRQFDKDGNDRNWWKPKTDARFKERAQCIIEQYGNYTVPENGLKVNGLNTQGENIADNGGIKEAFRAYRRWTKDFGREARLPGLEYSPDQLFWISAANIWCGKFRPEVLKLRVNSGVHSPARFRIIGPLSNSPEFSTSFNCPTGSPMNPRKKCSVW